MLVAGPQRHFLGVDRLELEGQASPLHPGHVQQIADESLHPLRGDLDDLNLLLQFAFGPFFQEAGAQENAREWIAEVMRDDSEDFVARGQRGLRFLSRLSLVRHHGHAAQRQRHQIAQRFRPARIGDAEVPA